MLMISSLTVAAPALSSDSQISTAGYFRLQWQDQQGADSQTRFLLQQADNGGFSNARTIYNGPDRASVISGLADNTYYYRVRETDSDQWSETVQVEVKHHPLSRALGFFALGAFMFVLTVFVLIRGERGQAR